MSPAQKAAIVRSREQQAIARDVRVNDFRLALRDFENDRRALMASWETLAKVSTNSEMLAEELTATGSAMRQILKLFHGSV